MSLEYLQKAGFTAVELSVYEFLVKNGETPASGIISGTKIKRPTVYKALRTLSSKGIVSLNEVRKKLAARPESPTKLLEAVENKSEEIVQIKSNLMAQLGALSSMYLHSTEKPIVRTYEGVEGLK